MPDVFEMLIKEHQKAKEMIAGLEDGEGSSRDGVFAQLKDALDMHMRFEEVVVYPEMKKLEELKDRVPEAVEEHAEGKALLRKLDTVDKGNEDWLATLEKLSAALEHHISEEEEEIFPTAREQLGTEKSDEMADKYVEMKDKKKAA